MVAWWRLLVSGIGGAVVLSVLAMVFISDDPDDDFIGGQ